MSTSPTPEPATRLAVFFDGPEPTQDRHGDEVPIWHVYVGDEEAQPVSRIYTVSSFGRGQRLAEAMARDRKLPLEADAMPAE